jgi:hypothetical protein
MGLARLQPMARSRGRQRRARLGGKGTRSLTSGPVRHEPVPAIAGQIRLAGPARYGEGFIFFQNEFLINAEVNGNLGK